MVLKGTVLAERSAHMFANASFLKAKKRRILLVCFVRLFYTQPPSLTIERFIVSEGNTVSCAESLDDTVTAAAMQWLLSVVASHSVEQRYMKTNMMCNFLHFGLFLSIPSKVSTDKTVSE